MSIFDKSIFPTDVLTQTKKVPPPLPDSTNTLPAMHNNATHKYIIAIAKFPTAIERKYISLTAN